MIFDGSFADIVSFCKRCNANKYKIDPELKYENGRKTTPQAIRMLHRLPDELFYMVIGSISNVEEMMEVADRLIRTRRQFRQMLDTCTFKKAITLRTAAKKRCTISKCRNPGEYCAKREDDGAERDLLQKLQRDLLQRDLSQKDLSQRAFFCKKHREENMIRCLPMVPDPIATVLHMVASGYTALLKLYGIPTAKTIQEKNTLRNIVNEAVLYGRFGTACYLISQGFAVPSSNFMFDCFKKRHDLGVKTCYQMGIHFDRKTLMQVTQRRQFRQLNDYLSHSPNYRELHCPGWYDTNWEMRLSCYFCNSQLAKWFVDNKFGFYDRVCVDLCMLAGLEFFPPCRIAAIQSFISHLPVPCDATTLSLGCARDMRFSFWESFADGFFTPIVQVSLLVQLNPDRAENEKNILWQLYLCAIRRDAVQITRYLAGRLALFGLDVFTATMLTHAINCKAWDVIGYFVKSGIRCEKDFVYPDNFHTLLTFRRQQLLAAGVKFDIPQTELFEMSLSDHSLMIGLMKSPVYGKEYVLWSTRDAGVLDMFHQALVRTV